MEQTPETPDTLTELRSLLLSPEQERILEIQERLDDPATRAREISNVLPEALSLRSGDLKLTAALMPAVQEGLQISAKRNPRALVEALFPVIGPAIRRSIGEMLGTMLQSLNQVLDRSLSIEGMQWRIEAWRSGRPFSEVALLHTLVYRVEQVFLIHQKTSLLLQHVVALGVPLQDADMVSGMLSAIRDFVHDSFRMEEGETLDTLKVGSLTLFIEPGPAACVVAVTRGTAPRELRTALQTAAEAIHRDHALNLIEFDGDASLFEAARPALETCLTAQYVAKDPAQKPQSRTLLPPARIVFILIGLILAAGIAIYIRNEMLWSRLVGRLNSESGLVVIDAHKGWTGYFLNGLRDPLAADPRTILQQSGISPASVQANWRPFQSAAPEIVQVRARAVLKPPATANIAFHDGVLVATGRAPETWLGDARRLALLIPGVESYDDSGLVSEEWQALSDLASDLQRIHIGFATGSTAIAASENAKLVSAAGIVNRLLEGTRAVDATVQIDVNGFADPAGSPEANLRLAGDRADVVVKALQQKKTGAAVLHPLHSGSAGNREVTFHVELGRTAATGRR